MIKIKVPGTSANIGPGFDCLGMAFDIYNEFEFEEVDGENQYIGFAPEYCTGNNMVYTAVMTASHEIGYTPKGLSISIKEGIPVSRGLGSSAACIVAGVAAAGELSGQCFSAEDIFDIASAMEGHPDNVAPSVYGGMTAAAKCGGHYRSQSIKVAEGLAFYALIPDFRLSTKKAREVLPKNIPRSSAVFNVAAVSMLITAISSGDFEILRTALGDRLHQPYRSGLIPGFDEIIAMCQVNGSYGAFLSGAGPTVMAVTPENCPGFAEKMSAGLSDMPDKWEVKRLKLDSQGLIIERL
jgi:homoserine kinase